MLAGQKRLEIDYKDPDILPKVNEADMAEIMEAIKEYLRLHHAIMRAPLAYVIRKPIIVQAYSDYHRYMNPDNEIITRVFHLPPDKNKLLIEKKASSVKDF